MQVADASKEQTTRVVYAGSTLKLTSEGLQEIAHSNRVELLGAKKLALV